MIVGIKFYQGENQAKESEAPLQKTIVLQPVSQAREEGENQAHVTDMENLSMKEMEKLDHEVEAIEEAWQEESKQIFNQQLHLSTEEYQEYLTMRKGYEEDRFEAYEQYHKKNLKEKGSYPITNEDDFNQDVLKEYQELFKKRFGNKATAIYLHALDSFNSALSKDRGQDAAILKVDF